MDWFNHQLDTLGTKKLDKYMAILKKYLCFGEEIRHLPTLFAVFETARFEYQLVDFFGVTWSLFHRLSFSETFSGTWSHPLHRPCQWYHNNLDGPAINLQLIWVRRMKQWHCTGSLELEQRVSNWRNFRRCLPRSPKRLAKRCKR